MRQFRTEKRLDDRGAGRRHGSFAAAGDFALQGHDVRLWRRDVGQVRAHLAAGSRIVVKDINGRHDVKLALVPTDIADAIHDTELILCPTPAFAQADIARLLAPHLREEQVVFLPPATFGSTIFAVAARDVGNPARTHFAETGRDPADTGGPCTVRLDAGLEHRDNHQAHIHSSIERPSCWLSDCRPAV